MVDMTKLSKEEQLKYLLFSFYLEYGTQDSKKEREKSIEKYTNSISKLFEEKK